MDDRLEEALILLRELRDTQGDVSVRRRDIQRWESVLERVDEFLSEHEE